MALATVVPTAMPLAARLFRHGGKRNSVPKNWPIFKICDPWDFMEVQGVSCSWRASASPTFQGERAEILIMLVILEGWAFLNGLVLKVSAILAEKLSDS
jgi:hypothetical protein